jgi:hypothetical protein
MIEGESNEREGGGRDEREQQVYQFVLVEAI